MTGRIVVIFFAALLAALFVFGTFIAGQIPPQDMAFDRCRSKDKQGDAGAIACYVKFRKDFPSNRALAAEATFHEMELYRKQGKIDEARALCQQLIDNHSDLKSAGTKWNDCRDRLPLPQSSPIEEPPLPLDSASSGNPADLVQPSPIEQSMPYTIDAFSFAISPNGKQLVFLATRPDGKSQLWIRDLESGKEDQPIPGTESHLYGEDPLGGANPCWKPDGNSIGYFEDNKLKRIDPSGGNKKTLADTVIDAGCSWSNRDVILFTRDDRIYRISAEGGETSLAARWAPRVNSHRSPRFLPDGINFLISATGPGVAGIYLGSLDNIETRQLQSGVEAVGFAKPNHLVFRNNRGELLTQVLDPNELELRGSPTLIADSVGIRIGLSAVSVSAEGHIAYRPYRTPRRQMVWRDRQGQEVGKLGRADDRLSGSSPRISPDGKTVAVYSSPNALFLGVTDGSSCDVNLKGTYGERYALSPVWTPGGDAFTFARMTGIGVHALLERPRCGSANSNRVLLASWGDGKAPDDYSPDGQYLLYTRAKTTGATDILALPLTGSSTPLDVVVTNDAFERNGRFAPNGKWISYESADATGRSEIFVQRFPGPPGTRRQVSANGGRLAQWSRDGRELYFLSLDNQLMAAPVRFSVDGLTLEDLGKPAPIFQASLKEGSSYTPGFDGRFLINEPLEDAPPVRILSNWMPAASAANESARRTSYGARTEIAVLDREGKRVNTVNTIEAGEPASAIALSADGKRLAFARAGGIRTHDLDTGSGIPIASNATMAPSPLWSPDGARVVYAATRNGVQGTYSKAANGSGDESLLTAIIGGGIHWSLDNQFIAATKSGDYVAWRVGTRSVEILFPTAGKTGVRISPDSRFVTYVESNQLWVQSFDPAAVPDRRWPVGMPGGPAAIGLVRWRADGKELYYLTADGEMIAVPIATVPEFKAGTPVKLFRTPNTFPLTESSGIYADISGDGQRFVFVLADPAR